MVGLKVGTCPVSWVAEERFTGRRVPDRFCIGINTAAAGAFAGAALHNRTLRLRRGRGLREMSAI